MLTRDELSLLVERYIAELPLAVEPHNLYAPIEYSLETGGKRIRPLLVLMGCNIFSDDVEFALPCAAAVEVFHNFTLLHDDIMDNAQMRRGKPAVHTKWSTNTAILSGDAMMICAYTLLEKTPSQYLSRVFAEFNRMAIEVCEGQQYDMEFETGEEVTLGEYINMIKLKTAALLGRAIRIGAIVGGASENNCDKLYNFCIDLGIAFQLQDDLLDTYGNYETLGKKVGGDILEAKKTFLTINALNMSDESTRRKLLSILHDSTVADQTKIDHVRSIYDTLGIKQLTEQAILDYSNRAVEALDSMEVDKASLKPLKELAMGLINRQK